MNRILYIQFTNPAAYPPLEHSSQILASAGWNVLFLGTGAAGANDLEFPPHPNITVLRIVFRNAGWRQKIHFLKYCAWVLWTAITWRPDWIYASDPLSCPAALILSFIPGVRVVYHEHDSPSAKVTGFFHELILRSRRGIAQRVDLCILPSLKRLERFRSELGRLRHSACVWNCPAASEAITEPRSLLAGPVWLLYHGSIVPDRLPLAVIDALALLPHSVCLRVAGYETVGSHGYTARLRERARELGLVGRVEFLGAIPQRADLMAVTRKSDIGLALMPIASSDHNCNTMAGASNKAFDYLACGLPVIVSDLADWREMFVAPGYGLACNPADAQSIAASIQCLVDNPDRMRAMGEAGRQRIVAEWNYENVFRPVFRFLSQKTNVSVPICDPDEAPAVRNSL